MSRGLLLMMMLSMFGALGLALSGCSDHVPASGGWRAMKFVRAEIIRHPAAERGETIRTAVTDRQTLENLLVFFPHAGDGRQSISAGHWLPDAQVQLFRADGSSVMVSVQLNTDAPVWHDATGEWPLKKGFAEFLGQIESGGEAKVATPN